MNTLNDRQSQRAQNIIIFTRKYGQKDWQHLGYPVPQAKESFLSVAELRFDGGIELIQTGDPATEYNNVRAVAYYSSYAYDHVYVEEFHHPSYDKFDFIAVYADCKAAMTRYICSRPTPSDKRAPRAFPPPQITDTMRSNSANSFPLHAMAAEPAELYVVFRRSPGGKGKARAQWHWSWAQALTYLSGKLERAMPRMQWSKREEMDRFSLLDLVQKYGPQLPVKLAPRTNGWWIVRSGHHHLAELPLLPSRQSLFKDRAALPKPVEAGSSQPVTAPTETLETTLEGSDEMDSLAAAFAAMTLSESTAAAPPVAAAKPVGKYIPPHMRSRS